jgi:hypothetical protein
MHTLKLCSIIYLTLGLLIALMNAVDSLRDEEPGPIHIEILLILIVFWPLLVAHELRDHY